MFKKIIVFITLIFTITFFSLNVSAETLNYNFTNTYQNPNRQTYNIDASTYLYYNAFNASRSLDSTIRFVVITDKHTSYPSYYIYNQVVINFNRSDLQIKEYNGYTYLMGKNYYFEYRYLLQDKSTYNLFLSGGFSSSSLSSSSFFIKFNNSSLNFKLLNQSGVTNIDEYIISDLSNTIVYDDKIYDKFLELNSTFSLNGETFINNADIQNPRYYGITLVDKQKFIDWIIDNNKYSVFANYGISNLSSTVDDIIDLYEEFNSSPLKFYTSVPSFLISNGSIFSSVDKVKQLYNLIDSLYQEFKISQQQKIFEVGINNNLLPHQRINSNTTDPIYTENIDDTLDVKLLREILKTLIQTPNVIYDLFDYYLFNISSNVSLVADYIAQIPEYLSTLIYNKFITPINSILDAINNIDVSGGDVTNIENNYITNIVNYLFIPTNTNKFNDFKINFDLKFNWINQIQDYPLKDFDFDSYSEEPHTFITYNNMTYNLIDFRLFNDYRPFIHGLIIALSYYRFLSRKFKNLSNIIMARTEEKE